jgi:hypothetical protein
MRFLLGVNERSTRVNTVKPAIALALCCALLAGSACAQDPYSVPPPLAAAQTSPQLEQLVAPIALYPDALVAQVLAAATYPTEIAEAASWMQSNASLNGAQLGDAVNAQPWDPSVKALTQFPSVLNNMNQNLAWTSALGEAYASEPSQVMDAVQAMRQRARAAGNLRSTSQETVTTQAQAIAIAPANPAVVYVPAYDPWLVYGPPLPAYPGWVGLPGPYYTASGVYFGPGFDIGPFAGFGWGWHHWGSDWEHRELVHDQRPWFSHSPTFGHPGHVDMPHAPFGHPEQPFGFHGEGPHVGSAPRPGAFSGFDHGGVAHAYSGRGHASLGGPSHAGGFAGGGFAHGGGGGFQGGGGHGGGGGGGHGGGGSHR